MSTITIQCRRCGVPISATIGLNAGPETPQRVIIECHGERTELEIRERPLPPHRGGLPTLTPLPAGGPPCADCGGATQRAGTCFTCRTCGTTTGCG